MLESRKHAPEKGKLRLFFLATSMAVMMLAMTGLIYSLFSHKIVLGADNLEISTLIAPVQMEPKPEPVAEPNPQKSEKQVKSESKLPTRREIIQRVDESPNAIPKTISTRPTDARARPNSKFLISLKDSDPVTDGNAKTGSGSGNNEKPGTELVSKSSPTVAEKPKIEEPPPVIKPTPEKPRPPISGGVVNGKAISLVKPVYSATAKNLGLKGEVKVQVTIDENGNVIAADAISGHALLRNSAVAAARASKFSPTTLSQQKVKVTGVIVYQFS